MSGLAAAMLLVLPALAHAHAKFFVESDAGINWQLALAPMTLSLVVAMVALAMVIRILADDLCDLRRPNCIVRSICDHFQVLAPLVEAVPVIARLALGMTLVLSSAIGVVASPAPNAHDPAALLMMQAALGLALIVGFRVRTMAVLVLGLLASRVVGHGMVAVLERLDIAGLAAFVALVGGRQFTPRLSGAQLASLRSGTWLLRFGCAAGLFVTAFTEKLANPDLTARVLAAEPMVDMSRLLPISQETFIFGAGGVEVLLALLVLLLPVAEIVAAAIVVPFILTVAVFGPVEIVGHMPIYGAMITLVLLGTHPQAAHVVSALRPRLADGIMAAGDRPETIGDRFPWREGRVDDAAAAPAAPTAPASAGGVMGGGPAEAPAPTFAAADAGGMSVPGPWLGAPMQPCAVPVHAYAFAPEQQAQLPSVAPAARPEPFAPAAASPCAAPAHATAPAASALPDAPSLRQAFPVAPHPKAAHGREHQVAPAGAGPAVTSDMPWRRSASGLPVPAPRRTLQGAAAAGGQTQQLSSPGGQGSPYQGLGAPASPLSGNVTPSAPAPARFATGQDGAVQQQPAPALADLEAARAALGSSFAHGAAFGDLGAPAPAARPYASGAAPLPSSVAQRADATAASHVPGQPAAFTG